MSSSSSTGPLLTLPRELRDRIYHYALSGLAYDVHSPPHVVRIEYRDEILLQGWARARKEKSGAEVLHARHEGCGWLLSCKQILAEGLAQFERASTCTAMSQYSDYSDYFSSRRPKCQLVRETLLLPLVRNISLLLLSPWKICRDDGVVVSCNWRTQTPDLPDDATKGLMFRQKALPNARRIKIAVLTHATLMSKLTMPVSEWPVCQELSKWRYQCFPGMTFDEAHFTMPEVHRSPYKDGGERVPHLALLAQILPKLQAHLIEHGKSLIGISKNTPSEQQHCEVRDWIDASTLTWHLTVKPRSNSKSSAETLKHDGLRYVRASELKRTPPIVGRYAKSFVFARDSIPKAGYTSWSCNETGETIWIQDRPLGSRSGYMREDAELMQLAFDNVFDELRSRRPEIAPVVEGMGTA